MTAKHALFLGAALSASCLFLASRRASAAPVQDRIVRLAELEIDPAQLNNYKAALREEIETSIRVEPGVLTLYAVSVKDHPNQIRLFEMYRDQASYQAHLQTPHFKKYKTRTQQMVKSLTLIETEPILLGSKFR
jgi:quinol monooxygenase YgiN